MCIRDVVPSGMWFQVENLAHFWSVSRRDGRKEGERREKKEKNFNEQLLSAKKSTKNLVYKNSFHRSTEFRKRATNVIKRQNYINFQKIKKTRFFRKSQLLLLQMKELSWEMQWQAPSHTLS